MKNKDLMNQEHAAILQQFTDAVKENNTENFTKAFETLANSIQESVMDEYKTATDTNDAAVMAARGIRQLTSQETKFYNKFIESIKSNVPQQALTLTDDVLPETIINAIFDEITTEHPLLDAINFQNTGVLTQILLSTSTGVAAWGELDGTIASELAGSFTTIDLGTKKLSAFIPVSKGMLEMDMAWLDKYVRQVLAEALAAQLEVGIVDGDGSKGPLGMDRALTGAVDGVYPLKTATAITDLSPVTFGTIADTISQTADGNRRAVPEILMVVNPADYYTKVFPAVTPRATDGTYKQGVLPYPTKIAISAAVPSGKAIFGLASRYFFGLGTQKGGKLEYSDQYKFLEDQRFYLIKLYGNGRPLDTNAFVFADISGLEAYTLEVKVTE
ncbi:MAG: phage major capsid protein, partial [Bacteroidaceae bacterium]